MKDDIDETYCFATWLMFIVSIATLVLGAIWLIIAIFQYNIVKMLVSGALIAVMWWSISENAKELSGAR